jgi:four helix bundle protein
MDKVRSYRDLKAWQEALVLVRLVYAATQDWPKHEQFGLTNQIRRAVVSVPSNIAEGQGRRTPREFRHHLSIAYGSLMEVETQVLIAVDLSYLTPEQSEVLLQRSATVGRLINGLINAITPTGSYPTSDPPPLTDI